MTSRYEVHVTGRAPRAALPGVLARFRWGWALGITACLVVVLVRPLLAADISGTWEISCWIGQDRQVITLELIQDGRDLSGEGILRRGAAGDSARVFVRSGTVSWGDFQFMIAEGLGPAARLQGFEGDWFGNEMSGLAKGEYGSRIFHGVRRRAP